MRKLYSLVLIAAGLLIGTNSWAATLTVGTGGTYDNLAAAVAQANNGDVIQVVSPVATDANQVFINKNLTLDLQSFTYTYTGSQKIAIAIVGGSLTIKGTGTLTAPNIAEDFIRIYGTYKKEATPFSKLVIENGVTLTSNNNAISIDVMRKDQAPLFGKTNADIDYACDFFKNKGTGYGVANGVNIEIAGKINAKKYGIKCNGTVRDGKEYVGQSFAFYYEAGKLPGSGYAVAADDYKYSPYIHITSTARLVTTNTNSSKAVAVYASGYARWLIEGYCEGSTGVYVKSGDVDINNAVVTSNYAGTYDPIDGVSNASGVTGAGSALAVESNANYSGNIDVTISGNSELTSENGYAVEEKVSGITAGAGETKVEAITIEGGTFSGSSAQGTITISETTVENQTTTVTVKGGTVEGSANIGDEDLATFISGGSDAHITVVKDENDNDVVIIAPGIAPTTIDGVKLNSFGLGTFSATETVTIPDGWTAWTANGEVTEGNLMLEQVNGQYIPAGTGVILYNGGSADSKNLEVTTTVVDQLDVDNYLKPATAWSANLADVYILHDNELWLYTGTTFPANKAFLQLPAASTSNGAPARISLRFAETEETQAVENVAPEAVKAVKFVGEDGKLYIRRGEAVYTVQGQLVK